MSVLFALAAAVGWGSSDFAAGHASRRSSAVSVVILTHFSAVIALLIVAVLPGQGGSPAAADIAWGLAAGLGGGFGAMLLFRGLGRGSMAVVAPITATGAAIIPVIAGLLQGESISALGALGVVLALSAIVMVSLSADGDGDDVVDEPADDANVAGGRPAIAGATAVSTAMQGRWAAPRGAPISTAVPRRTFAPTPLPPPPPPIPAGLRYEQVFGRPPDTALPPVPAPHAIATASPNTLSAPAPSPLLAALAPADDTASSTVALLEAPVVPDDISSLVDRDPFPPVVQPTDPATPQVPEQVGLFGRIRSIVGRPGIVDALFSGLGFGLFFVFIARTSEEAGHWPLVSARLISVVMFVAIALVTAGAVLPERGSRRAVVLAGVLDAVAALFFVLSTRSGLLSVGAVLASMYPAVTIVLARFIAQERIARRQVIGLALAAAAVSMLAL